MEEEQEPLAECPNCGQNSFVVSAFGSICSICFYDPDLDGPIEKEMAGVR